MQRLCCAVAFWNFVLSCPHDKENTIGVIMTHKVCTIPKFIAGGRFLVTPSTRLLEVHELAWVVIISQLFSKSSWRISIWYLFNIVCVLGGQPPAHSIAAVCVSRITEINSFERIFWLSSLTTGAPEHSPVYETASAGGSNGSQVV